MDDPRQASNETPIRRPPRHELCEPLEFERLTQTRAILDSASAAPIVSYLARPSALPENLVWRFFMAPDTAALAVLCRSLGLSRDAFEALTLSSAPTLGSFCLAPARALFDALSRARAERIVDCWRLC